jgi:hypothetical protein
MALPPVLAPPLKRKKMLSNFAVLLVNLIHSQENGDLHTWFAEIEVGSDMK